jgi:hypothetical protein
MDIWGPFKVPSRDGFHYFLTIVDDFSRCTWVYLMHKKSDTHSFISHFYNMVSTQFNTKIKTVRTDNGPEFSLQFY